MRIQGVYKEDEKRKMEKHYYKRDGKRMNKSFTKMRTGAGTYLLRVLVLCIPE